MSLIIRAVKATEHQNEAFPGRLDEAIRQGKVLVVFFV